MSVSENDLANAIRFLAADSVEKAKSGHPGLPMGAADIATVLFTKVLRYDIDYTHWENRDRFILSAGHGSMLLYSLLYLTGEREMTIDQLEHFRQWGSKTPGHPEVHHTPGVETTTGPLGQGIATSVGFALAERMLNAEFGDIVDHHTYVLCSDGDLMEGISQEALAIAGNLKLSRLIVMHDDNGISIDGPLSLSDSVDQVMRFQACGWHAERIDGHDPDAIFAALERAKVSDKPSYIGCKTTIGFGAPTRAGTAKAHGEALGEKELAGAREKLGWHSKPFEVPNEILSEWRAAGQRGRPDREAWEAKLNAMPAERRDEFLRRVKGQAPTAALDKAVAEFKRKAADDTSELATRKASEAVLGVIAPAVPELITGSADLTGSTNNKVDATPAITPGNYLGRFVHWGIREHGMVAAINGMSLHGGYIPSGATFLIFSDYCRPSIRLSALMKIRTIQLFTHDSIGLGEDGPTHQPVEQLAALRAIPNLNVFRPCDRTETAECWQAAIEAEHTPSILALTRQNLPRLRDTYVAENLCARGAYELRPAVGHAEVSIFASGSEVAIAVETQALLAKADVAARVVSVPCMDRFFEQDEAYRSAVIGDAPIRVGIEAAVRQGWDAVIGEHGIFVGMYRFGESAPYKKLYEEFGITAQAAADTILARIEATAAAKAP